MSADNETELAPMNRAEAGGSGDGAKKKPVRRKAKPNDRTHMEDYMFCYVAAAFQGMLLILYAISADYNTGEKIIENNEHKDDHGTETYLFYSMFQDVHAMMFVGFGFLMTFLRKYAFGAISFNFIICAIGIQWGIYTLHMISWIFDDHSTGVLHVSAYKLVDGDIATAVVLISFGALLGRTSASQLLVMCFFELIFWAINFHICFEYLKIIDVGGSIVVHIFGCYFGLAISAVLKPEKNDDDDKSMYHSDLFSMIGTLFLWLYWPSFNGYFANPSYYFLDRAYVNTVFGLCGSTAATFIVSRLTKSGKFNMVHVQNATLAGGVAVGAAADLYLHPAGALGVGCIAGALSVIGYEYVSDHMKNNRFLQIADTCGVHNLHGMPGILGGIVSAVALAVAGNGNFGDVYVSCDHPDYPFAYCDLGKAAGYQIAAICVTLGISITSGACTGLLMKWFFPYPKNPFTDVDNYDVPMGNADMFRGTIRMPDFHRVKRDIQDSDSDDDDDD